MLNIQIAIVDGDLVLQCLLVARSGRVDGGEVVVLGVCFDGVPAIFTMRNGDSDFVCPAR